MPCEISPPAEADLMEIGDYIARDNPRRAETFIDELLEHGEKIAQMPTAYAPREDLAPGLRACPHQRYIIFFRVIGTTTRIERILHAARDVTEIEFDL
ncbi:type II toxin-antitoxin system RelE/ParE family toxin [Piscinibacter koreensis]|uniref:Type II toxin-antitoxin system RelE/ParE family toxin n=1 Tax=Piscinibacter koreensis TaxID=2742824 RepID=A0A7Y6NTF0_9BURK|nr:type II toxin-antitoxin system RelE/ParE family toxin [Schlegelella koreensis]NUZ09001.1 type II toxin-antitoxin system RelE/ParE family toxin [Schlegelella koreensis]